MSTDSGCSECTDWFSNPLNSNPVTAERPECPIRGERCVRFPMTEDEKMEEAMRYDPSTQRDEDGPWGGGFARNH